MPFKGRSWWESSPCSLWVTRDSTEPPALLCPQPSSKVLLKCLCLFRLRGIHLGTIHPLRLCPCGFPLIWSRSQQQQLPSAARGFPGPFSSLSHTLVFLIQPDKLWAALSCCRLRESFSNPQILVPVPRCLLSSVPLCFCKTRALHLKRRAVAGLSTPKLQVILQDILL